MAVGHHVFLSYAGADNAQGQISGFAENLRHAYLAATGQALDIFQDIHDIAPGDHWHNKILRELRDSHILVACLSPAYLASDYCQWEFSEHLKAETAHRLADAGIAPVYAFPIPGWEGKNYEATVPEWVRLLRFRQTFDLRSQFPQATAGLVEWLAERIRQAEGARNPGFVDPHNPDFSGRERDMGCLRGRLASAESAAAFTILHGLAGIGKTSLAVEYAHNFAHEYPAGCWQVQCANVSGLDEAIASLASDLGFDSRFDGQADWEQRARRVLAELHRRSAAGHALLILDNVDDPELLTNAKTRILPRATWLHILITSVVGPEGAPDLDPGAFLSVDRLSEDDALRLIARLQPDADPGLVRRIVDVLGGFTLAIESAGVFLARFPRQGEALLEEFAAEGLTAFEAVVAKSARGLFLHDEKRLLTATLNPILDRLKADEWLTLELASLMPPDTVVWEWIESLVGDKFPAVEEAESLGEVGRWTAIRDRLQGLRLIAPTPEDWAGRMHKLVQETVWLRDGFDRKRLRNWLIEYGLKRCDHAEDWELEALRRWALHLMEEDEWGGGHLEERIANLLYKRGLYREEEPLRRHVPAVWDHRYGPQARETISAVYHLGINLRRVGRYSEAGDLLERALIWNEIHDGELHPNTLYCVSALGAALTELGDYVAAEPLIRRALDARERVFGSEHPDTLASLNNLAHLLLSQGTYAAAEPLFRRALESRERVLGPEHPDTPGSLNNLGHLLRNQGNYVAAETLFRRALAGYERVLGSEHPDALLSVNNLAAALDGQGNFAAAESLFRRALDGFGRALGTEHPLTLTSIHNLAHLLTRQGNNVAAEPLFRRASVGAINVLGQNHKTTPVCTANLQACLAAQSKVKSASP